VCEALGKQNLGLCFPWDVVVASVGHPSPNKSAISTSYSYSFSGRHPFMGLASPVSIAMCFPTLRLPDFGLPDLLYQTNSSRLPSYMPSYLPGYCYNTK
jgi:hypothetical protein